MKINTNFFVKGAFLNNKLYWTERDDGYLCYYDFENDSTMYEIDFKPIEFSAVVDSKEDFLLGVSQSGRWFWKYNINTKKTVTYKINCENYALDWIAASKIIDDNLVVIPSRSAHIIFINIDEGTAVVKDLCGKTILQNESERFLDEKVMVGQNEENEIISLCCKDKKKIIVGKNLKVEYADYNNDLGGIEDYFVCDEKAYAINDKGSIFEYINTNKKWKLISSDFEGYTRLYYYNDGLWVFPKGKGTIIHINKNGKRNEYDYPEDAIWREDILADYSFYSNNYSRIEDMDRVIFTPFGCNYMIIIDKKKSEIEFIKYTKFNKDNLVALFGKNYGIYHEGNMDLKSFISFVETI